MMGILLDKPETSKQEQNGCGNGLTYGISCMQGWRCKMEDSHRAVIGLPHGLKDWSFFAVFDGHTGSDASTYCADNLLDCIVQQDGLRNYADSTSNKVDNIELVSKCLHDGFLHIDEQMRQVPEIYSDNCKSGSTAVCVLISSSNIYFANCGDSRAVLSRDSKLFFCTEDHKPINPDEKHRIQKAGGFIKYNRINGSLAVSRSLGDFRFKHLTTISACEQQVSPEPDISVIARNDELDEFLLLACDGIWDVMRNDDLCKYIWHMLHITTDLEFICSSVLDACLHKGSRDNMSILLVVLPGAPAISEDAILQDRELNRILEKKLTEIISNKANSGKTLSEIVEMIATDSSVAPSCEELWFKSSFLTDALLRLRSSTSS